MLLPMMLPVGDGRFVPHWATFPEEDHSCFENFERFVERVWQHLGLPEPTKRQRRICRYLQSLTDKGAQIETIIRCFRGIGKSYIVAAYVLWRLMRNPQDEKVLVLSATGSKAKEFVSMVKRLLNTMDILAFLRPGPNNRDMSDMFDVAGASISQSYSVKAVGITGQVTGGRATLVIPDDIEIPRNSKTEDARAYILHIASEVDAIKLPEIGDVIYLGTPQTEESVYNKLVIQRGFDCITIPARVPFRDKLENYKLKRADGSYINILDPEIVDELENGRVRPGEPTDPVRFNDATLQKLESKGRAYFALQFQLDTSLSDAERYPLRTRDLITFSLNDTKAPMTLAWGHKDQRENVIQDIPNVGFQGDYFLRPMMVDQEWRQYEGSVLFVDPSGRGKDETSWAVVKSLNGYLYVVHVDGERDPERSFLRVAQDAKRFKVNVIEVEPNFAQGVWIKALEPVLTKVWPGGCTLKESEWAKGQKELRIIGTLEPVMLRHRLVIDESLVRLDAKVGSDEDTDSDEGGGKNYSLLYQLTHITRDRGSLAHDDRLDAMAGAVAHFVAALQQDEQEAAQSMRDEERRKAHEDFFETLNEHGGWRRRGVMRNGYRRAVTQYDPAKGITRWSGDDDDDYYD